MRPANAEKCSICLTGDYSRQPGFPSGHMWGIAMITYELVYATWEYNVKFIDARILHFFIFLSIVVYWARWYSCCHTHIQLIGGIFFGFITSIPLYLYSPVDKENMMKSLHLII